MKFQILIKKVFQIFILVLVPISCQHSIEICPEHSIKTDTSCECEDGYYGINCELEDPCILTNKVCWNGGICDKGDCHCLGFYVGEGCETYAPLRLQGRFRITKFELDQLQDYYTFQTLEEIHIPAVSENTARFGGVSNFKTVYNEYVQAAFLYGLYSEQCENCGDTLIFRFNSSESSSYFQGHANFKLVVKESQGKLIGNGLYYKIDYNSGGDDIVRHHEANAYFEGEKI